MITDDVRHDALVICAGYEKELIENELKTRDDSCLTNDTSSLLMRVGKDTLQYALINYELLLSFKSYSDSWQSLFESLREKERLIP